MYHSSLCSLTLLVAMAWPLGPNAHAARTDEPGMAIPPAGSERPKEFSKPSDAAKRLTLPQKTGGAAADTGQKSVAVAATLSFGTTLIGGALGTAIFARSYEQHSPARAVTGALTFTLAMSFGPSLGHFYAGEWRQGLLHALIRAAIYGTSMAFLVDNQLDGGSIDSGASWVAISLLFATTTYSILGCVDAGLAAKRVNERTALTRVALAPLVTSSPEGRHHYGLALAGRF